jgi:6-phosphogluconolactonase
MASMITPLHRRVCILLAVLAAVLSVPAGAGAAPPRPPAAAGAECLVLVGTYTGAKSQGIYAFRLDLATGKATAPELAAKTQSPSFLALHPNGRFLYAVGEAAKVEGGSGGAVSAFALEAPGGKLTLLNVKPSGGAGPCHLVVDRAGKHVLVANYGGGSVSALAIEADGRLGATTASIQHRGSSVNPRRQEAPHAHSINLDARNRFAFAADLGLDRVLVYRFDAEKGTLAPNDPPGAAVAPGAGPRHFAFHPEGRFAYAINEMHCTVTAFAYDAEKGTLKEVQTLSTLPGKVEEGHSTAEVQVHPSGKFLYGSNRGHNTIAVFAVDGTKGTLTPVEHQPTRGKTPRNFGIDPTGAYLLAANQDSDTIAVFRIDPASGRLQAQGEPIAVPTPVCVKFLPLAP